MNPRRRECRPQAAAGLLELLVVISLITVLGMIGLPVIQSARESARRLRCESNTRNFALAMIQCADVHGRLFENRFQFDPRKNCIAESLWFESARPFLELPPPAFEPGVQGPFPILGCPTAPQPTLLSPVSVHFNGPVAKGVQIATSDYVASAGVNSVMSPMGLFQPFSERAGLVADQFAPQSVRWDREVVAGRSHTLACWETSGSQRRSFAPGFSSPSYAEWSEDASAYELRSDRDSSLHVRIAGPSSVLRYVASSAGFMRGYVGYVNNVWQPLRDTQREQILTARVVNVTNRYHGPYSFHANTVSTAAFDGAVHAMSVHVDGAVLFRLATVQVD